MINDTIDILDARIINIRIEFSANVDYSQDKLEALNAAITEIQEIFEDPLDIGQPIYITKIYDRLNNLEEIVDVTNVKITNETGGRYSDETLLSILSLTFVLASVPLAENFREELSFRLRCADILCGNSSVYGDFFSYCSKRLCVLIGSN